MAETVGRVDFIANLDGRDLPRQVREMGEKSGKGFSKSFERNMRNTFDRQITDAGDRAAATLSQKGKLAGERFATTFDRATASKFRRIQNNLADILSDRESFAKYARGFDTIGEAVQRVEEDLKRLRDEDVTFRDSIGRTRTGVVLTKADLKRFSAEANRMGAELEQLGKKSERAAAATQQVKVAADKATASMDQHGKSVERASFHWKDLSHNTRQWTLIIGAVAAGIQDLAVLSSAAGAGILALGGALGSGVVGVGGLVAAFSVLGKDLADLPPHMQKVVKQFDDFKGSATGVRDTIASTAFVQMPDTFSKLSGTLDDLNPQFSHLGTVVGRTFDNFADGLKKGTAGFTELQKFISNATDDFDPLARAAGNWTVALLRGMNKANPMVDQLIGYIDKLGDRFDAFTRSNNFDTWVRNSMTTFSKFGGLLDATGRMLNDLVTPESIVRTQRFLDNLTAFMPNLGRLLDIIGRLDVFGLAASALNDFGVALEPIEPAVSKLAGALGESLPIAVGALADVLGGVLTVVAPLAEGFADIVDALPPEFLAGVTIGIGLWAASAKIAAGATVVWAAASKGLAAVGLANLVTQMESAGTAAGGLTGKLKGLGGKAGLFGAIGVGVVIASNAFVDWMKKMQGVDDVMRNAVAGNKSFADSFNDYQKATGSSSTLFKNITDLDGALNDLDTNDFWRLTFNGFGTINADAQDLVNTLVDLDKPLTALANTNMDAATAQFSAYAAELGATDEQAMNMINRMDGFKQALVDAAGAQGMAATDANILKIALQDGTAAAQSQNDVINTLSGSMALSGSQVDILSDKLRKFADQNLTTRSASRDYQAAIDDLTQSVIDNGTTLDINTEQGRNNEAAIDDLATKTLRLRDETLKQTGSQVEANTVIAQGREELIKQLGQFGITGQAAQDYVDKLGLVPANITTDMVVKDFAARKDLDKFISDYSGRKIPIYIQEMRTSSGRPVNPGMFATGGTVYGTTHAIIGEAGPEAVVPLNRPLSQVDPSVRALSAIAQGKVPALAGGGIGGAPSKTVIFEAGSIVVQGADDPRRAAIETADEIARRIGS